MAIKLDFSEKSFEKAKKDAGKDKDKKFGSDFSKALKSAEGALAKESKAKGDGSVFEDALEAVGEAGDEAESLIKDLDPKADKELIAALKKFKGDCDAEIKRLEEAQEEGEEDDEEPLDAETQAIMDELLNPECFTRYLKKAKEAKTPEDGAGFCFAFHKDAEVCKLTMLNPSKVKKEYGGLKRGLPKLKSKDGKKLGYKKRLMIYGTAYRDPENPKRLILNCDPKSTVPPVPGGADKKLKLWAKANKAILKGMKKLVVIGPDGIKYESDDLEDDATGAVGPESPVTAGDPNAAAQAQGTRTTAADVEHKPIKGDDAAAGEDRRKEFRKARQAWQSAKEKAVQDLEMVKDCIRDHYLDDPELFKVASSKLKQLDSIMDNLGDDLRDILDKYVSTPKSKQDVLQQLAAEASATVNRFLDYVGKDALLNAVDNEQEMGVADIKVREPLQNALKKLVSTLG